MHAPDIALLRVLTLPGRRRSGARAAGGAGFARRLASHQPPRAGTMVCPAKRRRPSVLRSTARHAMLFIFVFVGFGPWGGSCSCGGSGDAGCSSRGRGDAGSSSGGRSTEGCLYRFRSLSLFLSLLFLLHPNTYPSLAAPHPPSLDHHHPPPSLDRHDPPLASTHTLTRNVT